MVIGDIIKLKVKVFLNGLMEEDILDIIKMIKKMVMGFLNGLMERNIKVFGKMGNNMGKEKALILMKENGLKVFGIKEKKMLDVF